MRGKEAAGHHIPTPLDGPMSPLLTRVVTSLVGWPIIGRSRHPRAVLTLAVLVSLIVLPAGIQADDPGVTAPATTGPTATDPVQPDLLPRDPIQIARWVAKLGDPEFSVREEASDQLRQIGVPAISALEGATLGRDRETRYRAERLLEELYKHDLAIKVKLFRRNQLPGEDSLLPFWTEFKDRHGDSDITRRIYGDVLEWEGPLLRQVEKSPEDASGVLTRTAAALGTPGAVIARGTAVMLVFMLELDLFKADDTAQPGLYAVIRSPGFAELLGKSETQPLGDALFYSWANRSSGWMTRNALEQALEFGLPCGRLLALKELSKKTTLADDIIQKSVFLLAKGGHAEDRAALVRSLSDATVLNERDNEGRAIATQIRDIALAASIHLAGGNVRLEGFESARPDSRWLFMPNSLGFASDAERAVVRAAYEAKYPAPAALPEADLPAQAP